MRHRAKGCVNPCVREQPSPVQSSSSGVVLTLKLSALTSYVGRQMGGDRKEEMEKEKELIGYHKRINI